MKNEMWLKKHAKIVAAVALAVAFFEVSSMGGVCVCVSVLYLNEVHVMKNLFILQLKSDLG